MQLFLWGAFLLVGAAVALWFSRLCNRRFCCPKPHSSAVLVTGISSGLGRVFARDLALQGFLVFGTVRKQSDFDEVKAEGIIRPVMLDVTEASQVPAALSYVTSVLRSEGRSLCALVNNAGILGKDLVKDSAFAKPEHYHTVMATNVYGVVRVTEAFLPLLRECPGARIINIGSYFGDVAPGRADLAPYVTSKFAIEGLSNVWRRDLRNADVAVVLIKPGDFSTEMNALPQASRDLTPVVACVRDAVLNQRPLARYYTGTVALAGFPVWFLCRLLNVLPDALADKLM